MLLVFILLKKKKKKKENPSEYSLCANFLLPKMLSHFNFSVMFLLIVKQ